MLTGYPTSPAPAGVSLTCPGLLVWLCLPLGTTWPSACLWVFVHLLANLLTGLCSPNPRQCLLCPMFQQSAQWLSQSRVFVEVRRGRTRESWSDLKVHVFLPPPHPLHHPPVHSPGPGWRGHGWAPRVTQSALLGSVATLKLTHPGLPSGKRIPAKRDDSCVCDSARRQHSWRGGQCGLGEGGPLSTRDPGLGPELPQACQLDPRQEPPLSVEGVVALAELSKT